jgi:hypothetical protein
MENTSKQTSPISLREIAYYRRRHQNRLFSELAQFFAHEADNGRITRKEIAQKLSKDPAQITRWLSAPSNLELDTISDILLAMGAEMDNRIVRFVDRAKPNFAHPLTIFSQISATTVAANAGAATVASASTSQSIEQIFGAMAGIHAVPTVNP